MATKLMLWYAGNPKNTLREQVEQGIAHYQTRHKRQAEICLVNPIDFDGLIEGTDDLLFQIDGVQVRPWRGVVRSHALIGLDAEEEYESVIRVEMENYRKANMDQEEVPA